jgi:spore germination protein KC
MKKSITVLVIIIMIINILTGCWSKKELNEIAIASAIGIDKSEGQYLVTAQLMNPGEIAGQNATGARSPILTFRTSGKTVFEALRRLTTESPRRIYLAHIRVVIFGEELAKEGIANVLDFLARDPEFRADFYTLVAKDTKAEEVLSILTILEKIPANKIYSALETSERSWAATHAVQLDELINNIVSQGTNPVITGVLLRGNSDVGKNMENVRNAKIPALLKIGNLAAFKDDKLVGWLTEEESIGYNAMMGNIKNSVATIPWPEGGLLAIEVTKTSSKIKSNFENGRPKIEVNYEVEANIGEVQCDVDLTKNENISQIEAVFESFAERRIRKTIERAQQDLKSDILGFGEVIHRQNPKAWKNLKKNWNEEFVKLSVEILVKSRIRRLGTITNSPTQEKSKE